LNLNQAFQEISEYLQIDINKLKEKYEEISKKYEGYNKWSHVTEEEFEEFIQNIRNPSQLRDFYANTKNYIFELMEYHATEVKSKMRKHCIEIMKEHNVKTVLDYGCGIGQDSIEAAEAGLRAIAFDLPGKTFEFAKWRFKKRNLNITSIELTSDEKLPEKYDAVTCFEVVMHTPDPIKVIQKIYQILNENGLLFFTARFKGYKLALEYNQKYAGKFDGIIQDIGFERIIKKHMWGPTNEDGKYLYVYKKL